MSRILSASETLAQKQDLINFIAEIRAQPKFVRPSPIKKYRSVLNFKKIHPVLAKMSPVSFKPTESLGNKINASIRSVSQKIKIDAMANRKKELETRKNLIDFVKEFATKKDTRSTALSAPKFMNNRRGRTGKPKIDLEKVFTIASINSNNKKGRASYNKPKIDLEKVTTGASIKSNNKKGRTGKPKIDLEKVAKGASIKSNNKKGRASKPKIDLDKVTTGATTSNAEIKLRKDRVVFLNRQTNKKRLKRYREISSTTDKLKSLLPTIRSKLSIPDYKPIFTAESQPLSFYSPSHIQIVKGLLSENKIAEAIEFIQTTINNKSLHKSNINSLTRQACINNDFELTINLIQNNFNLDIIFNREIANEIIGLFLRINQVEIAIMFQKIFEIDGKLIWNCSVPLRNRILVRDEQHLLELLELGLCKKFMLFAELVHNNRGNKALLEKCCELFGGKQFYKRVFSECVSFRRSDIARQIFLDAVKTADGKYGLIKSEYTAYLDFLLRNNLEEGVKLFEEMLTEFWVNNKQEMMIVERLESTIEYLQGIKEREMKKEAASKSSDEDVIGEKVT